MSKGAIKRRRAVVSGRHFEKTDIQIECFSYEDLQYDEVAKQKCSLMRLL